MEMTREEFILLEKRLEIEKENFYKRPYDRGVEAGMLDVSEFSYVAFKKFTAMFASAGNYDLSDFTGEEKELIELYEFVRSEKDEKKFSIRIERSDNHKKTIEGLYNVAVSEEKETIRLPLADIDEEDQSKYLKGWISGIYGVWTGLDLHALHLV